MGEALKYVLYIVVLVGGLIGYWWWTQGRHGANAVKVSLGLRPDEEIRYFFAGFFKIGFQASDVALALVGVERVGKAFHLTLTQGGELVLKPQGDPPVRFRQGTIRLTCVKENDSTLVGMSGGQEPADVYGVEVQGGEPFRIQLARSAAQVVMAWSQGAAMRTA